MSTKLNKLKTFHSAFNLVGILFITHPFPDLHYDKTNGETELQQAIKLSKIVIG